RPGAAGTAGVGVGGGPPGRGILGGWGVGLAVSPGDDAGKRIGFFWMVKRRGRAGPGGGFFFLPGWAGPRQGCGGPPVGDGRGAASPLWEPTAALHVLLEPQQHQYHLPWLDAVRPDLDRLDLRPLLVLLPRTGWTPDFLSPAPAGPGTTIADQLAQVRATPPEQVAPEVQRSLTQRAGAPVPDAAWPLADEPPATGAVLADLLEQCWQLLIAPHWPRLRDLLDADLAFRAQTLAGYGLARVLGDLHPQARWTGRAIVIDRAPAARRHLRGAGLLLMPSGFTWPNLVAITHPPAEPPPAFPA